LKTAIYALALGAGPHTEEIRKMLFRFELDNINDKLTEVEV
jgi:hypothetical protein